MPVLLSAEPTGKAAQYSVPSINMEEQVYEIFISYSRKDRKLSKKLLKALEVRGWNIFLDESAIEPGERWDSKLESMLDKALCVLVLWTSHSYKSEWVRNEASEAIRSDTYFPVLLGDAEQPPLEYRKRQVFQLGDWKGDPETERFKALLTRLDLFIEKWRPQQVVTKAEVLDPLDQILAKTVDRGEQIAKIESADKAGKGTGAHQCWLFHCRTDDWPDALADHLIIRQLISIYADLGFSVTDSEATPVNMVGANAAAFHDALAFKFPDLVVNAKLDLKAWLSQGLKHKVVYLSLDLKKERNANAKLLAIKEFLDRLPPVSGVRVTVLVACFISDFAWYKRLLIDRTTKRLEKNGILQLPPLGLIGDEQTEQWVDGFAHKIRARYDTGWIKDRLWQRLQEGKKEEPYRKIKGHIEDALKQARLRRAKTV